MKNKFAYLVTLLSCLTMIGLASFSEESRAENYRRYFEGEDVYYLCGDYYDNWDDYVCEQDCTSIDPNRDEDDDRDPPGLPYGTVRGSSSHGPGDYGIEVAPTIAMCGTR